MYITAGFCGEYLRYGGSVWFGWSYGHIVVTTIVVFEGIGVRTYA